MNLNQVHLDLLRKLPVEVHAKLRECGPGFTLHRRGATLRATPKAWERPELGDLWLPCSESAILDIASAAYNDTHPDGPEHLWYLRQDFAGGYVASVEAGAVLARGMGADDPHEAALRLLLAVCPKHIDEPDPCKHCGRLMLAGQCCAAAGGGE